MSLAFLDLAPQQLQRLQHASRQGIAEHCTPVAGCNNIVMPLHMAIATAILGPGIADVTRQVPMHRATASIRDHG